MNKGVMNDSGFMSPSGPVNRRMHQVAKLCQVLVELIYQVDPGISPRSSGQTGLFPEPNPGVVVWEVPNSAAMPKVTTGSEDQLLATQSRS